MLDELGIPQPPGHAVTKIEDGVKAAEDIGYPVLVRPSFVLGGRAMQIVSDEAQLRQYLKTAVEIDEDKPVLVDKYILGKEVEVDAVCDGRDVFVPGIMELVERTGVHSGDSISVYPTFSISNKVKGKILQYAKKLGPGIGIIGLYNIQFIVDENEEVYIIEVNPRSSRTVPFLSKSTGYSLADIATEVMLGKSLKEQGIFDLYPEEKKRFYVKVPVFSSNKIKGLDTYLSPEMKRLMDEIQLCLDTEDRKSLTKACEKIAKIQQERGRDAVPASVRAKAVEAIGLFLPASLAELVDFMADSDPEVVESVFDQLDNLLNDTTIGDKELSGMLVAMSKVLSDEDSIDSMAMAIDCNMRNSVKVATYCKIIETGTPEVVTRMKESIAEMMEVEVSDLPSNPKVLENQLNEWLEENPDGEDDADFYKGVDD